MMSILARCVVGAAMVAGVMGVVRGEGPATTTKAATAPAPKSAGMLEALGTAELAAGWELLGKDDFEGAQRKLGQLLDLLAGYGTDRQANVVRETAYALRLARQLDGVEGRGEILAYLKKNENIGHTLAFLMVEGEDPRGVFGMLNRLRAKYPKEVEAYANLAAAICVVHDGPFGRQINENAVKSPDGVAIFEFYVKNEGKMYFGVKGVPAELLAYVVDTTSPIEQMAWALEKFRKDDMVGRHFFDIKYDFEHFRKGTPKKVTEMGYSLQNIEKFGGVCADQAYFAMEVGKAIGVPTAYAAGESGDTGHAWVGFLQAKGNQGWWNFDIGRYEEYRGVKGVVMDPQTRRGVPDSYVSLMAEMIGTKAVDRQVAVAWSDAAMRVVIKLAMVKREGLSLGEPLPEGKWSDARALPRQVTSEGALELLELGLRRNAGYARGWLAVRGLAKEGLLTLAQKQRWGEIVLKLCGQKYPDFAWAIIEPMIQTVEDTKEQDRMWNWAFGLFPTRADLAASVRMSQAKMWEQKGDMMAAGKCYWDVIEKFSNAGPFVLPALVGAEKMLRQSGKKDKVLALYEQTWGRIKKPDMGGSPFVTQSNWYRVGEMFAMKLREAGEEKKAAVVEGVLEPGAAKGK